MGVDLDPLDDIFSDEVVKTVKRPTKFQPKAKFRPPPKNPSAAPEVDKSRAQAAPSGLPETGNAKPLDKNCDLLPQDDGVLHSSIEKSAGENAGIYAGLEMVGDFVPSDDPDMGTKPLSEVVAAYDSNPGISGVDLGSLTASEPVVSTEEIFCRINDDEPRTEEMEVVGAMDVVNLITESGPEGGNCQPDLCTDNPFDRSYSEKYSSPTFQHDDDVLDLSSLGFPDPSPNEVDPNIQSNLDSLNIMDTTQLDSGVTLEPAPEETRRAETRRRNTHVESCANMEAEMGNEQTNRVNQISGKNVIDKGSAARKCNMPEGNSGPNPKRKRFSHSTRRRRVNMDLLETPEDEIEYQKVTLRDLILLGEHKEKQMKKEEATSGTSQARQSVNGENIDRQGNARVGDTTVYFNYQTYMDKTRIIRWTKQDTEMFYEAIRQFGTDLSLIQQLFPGLSRRQIKLKFQKEERQHPLRLHEALTTRSKDHSHFKTVIKRLQQMAAERNQNIDKDEDHNELTDREMNEGISQTQDGESKEEQEHMENESVKAGSPPILDEEEEEEDLIDWSQYKSDDV